MYALFILPVEQHVLTHWIIDTYHTFWKYDNHGRKVTYGKEYNTYCDINSPTHMELLNLHTFQQVLNFGNMFQYIWSMKYIIMDFVINVPDQCLDNGL